MRILLTIPHFFDLQSNGGATSRHGSQSADASSRRRALAAALLAPHQLWGRAQCMMQLAERRSRPANDDFRGNVDVVVCTTEGRHLINDLPVSAAFFEHFETRAAPELLGFECHAVLRDRFGDYDWYGYLEDDLILHDPWFLAKLEWFAAQAPSEALLQPNRFERGYGPLAQKAYVDGDLAEQTTKRWQNIREHSQLRATVMGRQLLFHRPLNPHSGCFILSAAQMGHWLRQPHFLNRDTSFIGPLESAATLGIMQTFRIYKPARSNASFLEIEHYGTGFISQLRRPGPPG